MDSAAATEILRLYPERYAARRVTLPPHATGFSGASVFQVDTAEGLFALRRWPPSTSAPRLRSLHRLLLHLWRSGIHLISVPIGSKEGFTLVGCQGNYWQLEPWLAGQADFWEFRNSKRLQGAAAALAQIHRAASTFPATAEDAPWFETLNEGVAPAVMDRIDRLQTWSGTKLARLRAAIEKAQDVDKDFARLGATIIQAFRACAEKVAHELRTAQLLRVPLQPCLRDIWHDHVLFVDDCVSGIIDLSAARTDTVAADLSRMLGSLVGDDRAQWQVALSTYEGIRPLCPNERTLIEVLDHSAVLLSGMTWLERRFLRGVRFEQPERVLQRLGRITERLQILSRAIQ